MEKGTYALVIALERESAIAVGKLGRSGGKGGENEITFPSGYYIYVGSARGGLPQRVRRHLRGGGGEGSAKKLRWHIDYLLQFASVIEVWYAVEGEWGRWGEREESQECFWCHVSRGMPDSRIPVPGFGSSDCRCPAHLIYFPSLPSFEIFRKGLGEEGAQLKRAKPGEFLNP